ncbi:unnamed protein product [Adineta steineri]|uniref:Uncharacterized protein n=2 Tax=Adineta steineri TaxID=433720 RepID=A0A814LTH8_9BILA|nr:unnamed protein product [Adineta steineri]
MNHYKEQGLPSQKNFYATAFPYWDTMFIQNGTSQGLYYSINGKTPNRTIVFEYYTTVSESEHRTCHFQVLYSEANPGTLQFIYLAVPDGAKGAVVGIQGSNTGPFLQYSFQEPYAVLSNMSITFDTKNNNYTAVLLCGSKTCTMNEACVRNMCIQRGRLSFTAHWPQRKGQGYIIVRTPLNNTIYFGSPRNKSSVDQGQHELIGDGNQVDNVYWSLNSMPPKGLYTICFSTGSLLNGTDKSPVTVTIEIRRFRQRMETMSRTFNRSTTKLNECLDTSDTFIDSFVPRWSTVNSMKTSRQKITASRLLTGQVLVVGGTEEDGATNTTELYDPLSGNWTSVTDMSSARQYHTTSVLSNGKVLVIGGDTIYYNIMNTAELYDPSSKKWTNVANMTASRRYHTATVLTNGKVLVVGGYNGSVAQNTAELYDPLSNNWIDAGNMGSRREQHTASLLSDGKVLIVGGGINHFTAGNSAEIYDPSSRKWTNVGNMSIARMYHTASVLLDGKVLVVGGYNGSVTHNTAELYDPSSRQWTNVANMTTSRSLHTATVLSDGKVLVVGGENNAGWLDTAELYDPSSRSWTPAARMTYLRSEAAVVTLLDGNILMIGGSYRNPLKSVELYYP